MLWQSTKAAIVVALLAAGALQAQVRSSSPPGQATLRVLVLTESHSVLDTQALVRVRNIQQGDEHWATTHLGSDASISGLARDTYSLEVNAVGFDTYVGEIELHSGTQTVQVVLQQEKKKTTYAPPDTSGISRKARDQCAKGIAALQAGNAKGAEKAFRKALKSAASNGHVNYLLAVALLQQRNRAEAAQYFQQAITLDPTHVPGLTALGGLRFEAKDYAGAASLLERAIAASDRQWRPYWLLANVYLAQQEYEKARDHAERAVKLSEHAAPYATLALAEALNGLGRYQEAVAAMNQFLEQAPTSPDAPEVRKMIAILNGRRDQPAEQSQAITLAALSLPLRTSSVVSAAVPAWGPADVDSASPPVAPSTTCPASRVLAGVTQSITELVDNLGRFSAHRTQMHEQLNLAGNPVYRQSRKTRYLLAIVQPRPGWLELNEYSQDLSGLGAFTDGILTRGMLGLALIFHPALENDYQMDCEGLGEWKGEPAWLVHFRQKADRPPRLQSFRYGGKEVSIALKGRAWIAASGFRILHIEADLLGPATDIDLRSEHQMADYGPVEFKKKNTELWLPKNTQTYLDLAGRHYVFSDRFDDFVLYSVDTHQEVKPTKEQDR